MSRWKVFLLLVLVCLATMPASVVAQQQVGGLRISVTDPTGSVIPGADINLNSAALIRPIFGVSDEQGLFIHTRLPPGNYTVTARFPGFQTAVNAGVVVQLGRTFTVEMTLEVGQVTTTIVVEAGTAAIDTDVLQLSKSGNRAIDRID